MRRIITTALAVCLMALTLSAQTESVPGVAPALDSTLMGKNIFTILPSRDKGAKADVTVHQSQAILKALNNQIANNSSRKVPGYRVRIFNDNKQTSRGASEAALNRFKGMFPGIAAYRTYTNPYFRVTVGDFRTKSEALELLQKIPKILDPDTTPTGNDPSGKLEQTGPEKEYTYEQVRGIFTEKSSNGQKDEMRKILTAHGLKKLSDAKEDQHLLNQLASEAEAISNA